MSTLSAFIRKHSEEILAEWETFARALPMGASMDVAALRDHAKAMLGVIASDLEQPQTPREQSEKARGEADAGGREKSTAASEHGSGRAQSGFAVEHMVAEFRALRASVIRLWTKTQGRAGPEELEDMIRFNEAIDQAIAESLTRYAHDIDQTKERFLAILGHDLRTPLGAIITSTQFMLDTNELAEPYLTLVRGVANSSRRMNQMVSDLLDFALTRFGDTIPTVRAPMDIGEMVREVAAEVSASYPRSTVRIETTGVLTGEWDRERLMQAVTNLVGNAIHHGAPDSPVSLSAYGDADQVRIVVCNEGPMIPQEDVGRIFDAMTRGRGGKRDRRHLGLGLYIVDKIAVSHGGHIGVESSEKNGTRFTLYLPRAASSH